MRSVQIAFFAGVVCVAMATNGVAGGDPEAGRKFAAERCARCHDISPGGQFKQHPPSFASIAVFRSADQIWERIAVPPQYRGMPDLDHFLTGDRIEDIVDNLVAYIVSLETQ